MDEMTFTIKRDRVARYMEVLALLRGLVVVGWLLLRLGLGRAIRGWADSLEYRLGRDTLSVSSCIAFGGVTLCRQTKSIPLAKITDVKLIQGPVLSRMGLWSVHIQTAGVGHLRPEATLYGLDEPHEARDRILQAIAARSALPPRA